MAARECGDCYYYEKCDNEDCPPDKGAHGFCYVDPPKVVTIFDAEGETIQLREVHSPGEVGANGPGCRHWTN